MTKSYKEVFISLLHDLLRGGITPATDNGFAIDPASSRARSAEWILPIDKRTAVSLSWPDRSGWR